MTIDRASFILKPPGTWYIRPDIIIERLI